MWSLENALEKMPAETREQLAARMKWKRENNRADQSVYSARHALWAQRVKPLGEGLHTEDHLRGIAMRCFAAASERGIVLQ